MSNAIDNLIVYVPMDRRQALISGASLPERVHGAALFADIDGFTALTDHLLNELGPQRGAEELTFHLNQVYDAVIDIQHQYGASVIAFAGDAVTSWIAGDDGRLAVACALAIREAMAPFDAVETPGGNRLALSIKVAIAVGPALRYQVGDPEIRLLDALAGNTLQRLAEVEHLTESGEIVVDEQCMTNLTTQVDLLEVRRDPDSGVVGGVVGALHEVIEVGDQPLIDLQAIDAETIRPWLHRPVYTRLRRGLGDFLAELRSTVALFVRFSGIDYDNDPEAGAKLDGYIRWVQQVAARYEGTLIDLNIGDKGSYLYINFGALLAHEDSAERALSAALDLRRTPAWLAYLDPVQIGISSGRMRVGAYGGTAHRTYGALGAEVNMAARLMMAAEPGQILVSQNAADAAGNGFIHEDARQLRVKGRSTLITVSSLREARLNQDVRIASSIAIGPLVGRRMELAQAEQILRGTLDGHGQLVGIRGDAGVGKSRLIAEILKIAEQEQLAIYSGECQSYGVNANYLVWQPVWRALLEIDARWDAARQTQAVRQRLAAIDPRLEIRYPLMGTLLNIDIPDNELTAAMDAKTRKSALESMLIDFLTAISRWKPTVILLEDCHWLDPLSQDLLDAIGQAVAEVPLFVLLAFRRPELDRLHRSLGEGQANYSELKLDLFDADESEAHIRLMLEQLYGEGHNISAGLVQRIRAKAEGNAFYIVELLTDMRDRGIDPGDSANFAAMELPDSLHTLALSRVDRLPEHEISVLKVASVVGRNFHADWLHGAHSSLGTLPEIVESLNALSLRNILAADPDGQETTHLFRQTIVQDALYESVPHSVRTEMHEEIGRYLEIRFAAEQEQHLDLLALHYDRSGYLVKKIEYLRRAGESAQAKFANEAAIDYYERVLPLLSPSPSIDILLKLGDVLQLVGRWDEAGERYQAALKIAQEINDLTGIARGQRSMGRLLYHERPADALVWLEDGLAFVRDHDMAEIEVSEAAFLIDIGWARFQLGQLDEALASLLTGLERLPDTPGRIRGNALSSVSSIYRRQGDVPRALAYAEQALANGRELPDLWLEQIALNNLAGAQLAALDWRGAVASLEEASELAVQIGDKRVLAALAINLGQFCLKLGDVEAAEYHLEQALSLTRENRLAHYELVVLIALASLNTRSGQYELAGTHLTRLQALIESLSADDYAPRLARGRAELHLASGRIQDAAEDAKDAIRLAKERNLLDELAVSQRVLGQIALALGQIDSAVATLSESYEALDEQGKAQLTQDRYEAARSQFYLGQALIASGEGAAGKQELRTAHETFKQLSAGFDLKEAEAYWQTLAGE